MTKQQLYYQVETFRKAYSVNYPPPYDAKMLCTSNFKLHIDVIELKTPNLRGMSHIPSRSVIIDSKLSAYEQNFYCMHEIMHHLMHKDRPTKSYSGYDKTQVAQDPIVEWEANEGAAQFLIPYRDFIPRIKPNPLYYLFPREIAELAGYYNTTIRVVRNRLRSLRYEIYQYQRGVPIDSLEILSINQLRHRGIDVPCYSDRLAPTHYTPVPPELMKFLIHNYK